MKVLKFVIVVLEHQPFADQSKYDQTKVICRCNAPRCQLRPSGRAKSCECLVVKSPAKFGSVNMQDFGRHRVGPRNSAYREKQGIDRIPCLLCDSLEASLKIRWQRVHTADRIMSRFTWSPRTTNHFNKRSSATHLHPIVLRLLVFVSSMLRTEIFSYYFPTKPNATNDPQTMTMTPTT